MRMNGTLFRLLKKIDGYFADMTASGNQMPNGLTGMKIRAIISYLVYGTSFSEYFGYRFWSRSIQEKRTYMTRRYMFRFFDQFNPPEYRDRIGDKSQMKEYYGDLMKREQFLYSSGREAFGAYCKKYPKLFIKKAVGWGGDEARIEVADSAEAVDRAWESLSDRFVVEPCLENCDKIKALHPGSLNTIKIVILQIHQKPEVQTAIFRMGNQTEVDNVHSGGIAAGVDIITGTVITPARDKHFKSYCYHPYTGEKIIGFEIPFWDDVVALALKASERTPQLKYVSWDIAVTKNGPVLIEGNWDAEFYAEQEIFETGLRKRYVKLLEEI